MASAKGTFGGVCATPDCETTGAIGIVGPAPLYASGDEMNVSHRCGPCRESVMRLLVAAWNDGTIPGGMGWEQFIEYGRGVLSLPVVELHNMPCGTGGASDRDA